MKTCTRCGERFTPMKPFYKVCFPCHLAQVRESVTERKQIIASDPRINQKKELVTT